MQAQMQKAEERRTSVDYSITMAAAAAADSEEEVDAEEERGSGKSQERWTLLQKQQHKAERRRRASFGEEGAVQAQQEHHHVIMRDREDRIDALQFPALLHDKIPEVLEHLRKGKHSVAFLASHMETVAVQASEQSKHFKLLSKSLSKQFVKALDEELECNIFAEKVLSSMAVLNLKKAELYERYADKVRTTVATNLLLLRGNLSREIKQAWRRFADIGKYTLDNRSASAIILRAFGLSSLSLNLVEDEEEQLEGLEGEDRILRLEALTKARRFKEINVRNQMSNRLLEELRDLAVMRKVYVCVYRDTYICLYLRIHQDITHLYLHISNTCA